MSFVDPKNCFNRRQMAVAQVWSDLGWSGPAAWRGQSQSQRHMGGFSSSGMFWHGYTGVILKTKGGFFLSGCTRQPGVCLCFHPVVPARARACFLTLDLPSLHHPPLAPPSCAAPPGEHLWSKKSRFYLFYEVHEAGAEPPGLVPVALQGVHGHLRRALVAHGHHVHRVVQQGSVCLKGRGTALVAVGCCRKRWNPPCVTPCQPQGFSVRVPC